MLTRRESRKVKKSLTVQYDCVLYLLGDTPEKRTSENGFDVRFLIVYRQRDSRIKNQR